MLLEVKNLTTRFYQDEKITTAVNDISFKLEQGKTLCIVGESGSGKSMTSLSLMRLIEKPGKIDSGEVFFEGVDLLKIDIRKMRQIRGGSIAMIFQEPMTSLNPSFTVGFQIDEALKLHQKSLNKKQRKEKVIEALAKVGIKKPEERYHQYPFKLSGGQRQRVMIAMAMVCKPKLLIADEPTTALDVTIQAQVLELMRNLQKENNTAILFITHDLGVVYQMADDVIVMYKGHMLESASKEELFKNPTHPYTKALLSSIPKIGKNERKKRLSTVDESVDYLKFERALR